MPEASTENLNGVWERKDRNPLVGAFLLILATGGIYFIIQAIVLNGVILIDIARTGSSTVSVYGRYQWFILTILAVTQYGLLLVLPLLVIRRWHTSSLVSYFHLDRFHLAGLIAATVGAVALLPLVDLLARYFYSLAPFMESLNAGTGELLVSDSRAGRAFIYFAIAVTPAVCEETLFRSYFQRTLERRIRAPWHFLLSGTIFALFHQQILTLPSLVLVGIFLSYMYYAFQSPYPTILAHFAYNGIQIFLVNRDAPIPGVLHEEGFTGAAVVAGTAIAVLTILFAEVTRRRTVTADAPVATAQDTDAPDAASMDARSPDTDSPLG